MSAESMRQLINRAVAEPEFRGLLFANPRQAAAGYNLTQDEAAALSRLSAEEFDAAASALETRESRATFSLGVTDAQPRQPIGY